MFLSSLEDEAIYILRETAAQFLNPFLLFSGGKDSICLVHLSIKAFAPAPVPFSLLHIDTGHNFPEVIAFRDRLVNQYSLTLVTAMVEDTIRENGIREEVKKYYSRNQLQSITLLNTIRELGIDACIGGARRDEEKARAKERIFSFRNTLGEWDARNQRPELFHHLNGFIHTGENVRVFPLSNWTEKNVWKYISENNIAVPSLYFAHERMVFHRDGLIWAAGDCVYRDMEEIPFPAKVRFRTVGDMTCTAGIISEADTISEIMYENFASGLSERGARIDDKVSEGAMEKRKKEGYF
ncbi:MAG: sulfate adenylyltransferase subunit 2 [Bacteroidia bacterium]|nr:sulfate adenylyltransferase subunit 2 [Bacteroidia bacterium]